MVKVNIDKLKRENEVLRLELQTLRKQNQPTITSKLAKKSSMGERKNLQRNLVFDFKYLKRDLLKTLVLTGICVATIVAIFVIRMVY